MNNKLLRGSLLCFFLLLSFAGNAVDIFDDNGVVSDIRVWEGRYIRVGLAGSGSGVMDSMCGGGSERTFQLDANLLHLDTMIGLLNSAKELNQLVLVKFTGGCYGVYPIVKGVMVL